MTADRGWRPERCIWKSLKKHHFQVSDFSGGPELAFGRAKRPVGEEEYQNINFRGSRVGDL
jgi:hypothetical protein